MDVIVNHSLPTLALAFEPQLGDVSVIVHYPLPLCPQVKIASMTTSNFLEVKEGNIFYLHLVRDLPGLPQDIQVRAR